MMMECNKLKQKRQHPSSLYRNSILINKTMTKSTISIPDSVCQKSTLKTMTIACVAILLFLTMFASFAPMAEAKKQKDGKFATTLDEYHSTIKCMLNIAEETLPELNDYITCCGFWAITDFTIHKVDTECDPHNLEQVRHLTGLVEPHIRQQCVGYEQGSFTCRLLVIMPFAFALLFVIFMVSVCVCACVSFYKWTRIRTKYRIVMNADNEKQTINGKRAENIQSQFGSTNKKTNYYA